MGPRPPPPENRGHTSGRSCVLAPAVLCGSAGSRPAPAPGASFNQQAGLQHVLPRIVHPGDQRDADDERPARKCTAMPGCAGWGAFHPSSSAAVLHRVGVLHVEQHQIGVPRHRRSIRRGIAARLDGRMHPPRPATRQSTSAANAALQERLAAREASHRRGSWRTTALLRQQFAGQLPRAVRVPAHRAAVAAIHILRLGEMPSGLWHQAQRSGHPFRETVVRIPARRVWRTPRC